MSWLMFLHQFLLLFLLSSSSSSSSTSARHTCLEDQRFSLLQFKTTFTITANASLRCESDSHPKMVFWNESGDCCSWEGVTCDWSNGHVIGLDLSCSHLHGTIQPNTTLFHLRHLQTLNLAFNDFNFSTISPDFGSFPSLTHLNLSYSNFTGRIPSKICHLSKLVSLDLSYFNHYPHNPYGYSYSLARLEQHTFNMLLRNLTQLRELHLDSLNISSPLPHALLNLSSLTSLSLRYCQLRGKFSENIFHFPNLRELCVSGNSELTGKLPYFNVTSSLQFLDLFGCKFSGSIPASLGNLTQITYLDFGSNSFGGQIPSSISNLAKLNTLYLDGNNLTGQIPDSLGNMSQLTILYLDGNNLTGQIPDSLGNMSQLTILYLSGNNLNGQIPDSLGNMSQLTILCLSRNNLNGQIPDSLGNMSQLTSLDLSYNSLNGTIPSSLFAVPSLVYMDLSNNKLQGPIPGLVYELQNLTRLGLSSNNLSGVVELDKLLSLKYLSYLDLSYNGLSLSINNSVNTTLTNFDTIGLASCNLSEFPIFLREQAGLNSLDLSNNKIHGAVPKWLFNMGKDSLQNLNLSHNFLTSLECLPWKNLAIIDLHSNLLRGPFPVPPNSTYVFSISNNKLTGEIPTLICNLRGLAILDLSNNSLSGLIPQCLGNLSNSLSVLNLGINSFRGRFIATFTKGNMLRNLNLNGNQIEGQVPRSLLNCRHLEVLDLGKNKINDTFPHWLETLTELQVLVLRFNRFHGHIGTSKTKGKHPFPKLRIIDISCNEFTGLLPTNYIKQFGAMINVNEHEMKLKYMGDSYYQDSVAVMIKGYEIELSRILTVLSIIDFSRNKFQGEIPKSIGRLNSLRGLNLSHNNLEGRIPTSLGNLKNLESLDLSSNKFVGEIPQQLKSLMFLEVLNLSDNQLAGPIPQGSQFNTFGNDSYSGNSALCGFPLSKKCEEQQPLPSLPTLQHDENSDWEGGFNWKVVVMGYGCGFVFGMVMGYLMLVTRSPKWLMKIVEGKQYKKGKRSKKSAH
ncbi:receptor-like protein 6 [Camellia sinensis]|uniref:receptor-like protein 6 n=1 Tax=Camellia sinensis TaxID=4442 RepID=UPI0010364CD4|nr:receptor-like protein 6 [Camellia sinensis]XP_028065316.1 receptor-like protein 6 [Camellia sinensis]XP_028065317.1 receptor-like protein 6 [Camellia sinensis]XP_028065318.1 receptor-like protein 6 [Camellia sinensis]XP_028065319.1 receptor-like protein 6 [Camellia sinensis]XP_028065320.1 receptor-like protein 6 [Camellia sinensis]XP_028065321.1 receptor-like protein 6 [Camellia sinensis]XP_028065322.1 receptor-like protein 6 [Camellia sinensis]XP_028065323.1 receptor-like protein 6 [Cam